ncbi:MAG: hypothetical protein ACI9W2_001594 [Gammaproteobacteria bacterium]
MDLVGPVLFARGATARTLRLSALLLVAPDELAPVLVPDGGSAIAPVLIYHNANLCAWRYDFTLPARAKTGYNVGDTQYPVCGDIFGDMRIGYVSCNGEAQESLSPADEGRNDMWKRLANEHQAAPFHLLLHGGDQLYADGMLDAHSRIRRWRERENRPYNDEVFSSEMREAAEEFLVKRYCELYRQPHTAHMLARVPNLMIWDDHDIVDGWGSFDSWRLDSPVGEGVFALAREMFLLFQMGHAAGEQPVLGSDPSGRTLTWTAKFPDLCILAPDLRSERTPEQVLGEAGWSALQEAFERTEGSARVLMLASVPLIAPKFGLIDRILRSLPFQTGFEGNVHDQWQARVRRPEWRQMLELLSEESKQHPVTVLSGEIHLAGRGEMRTDHSTIHQLISSGIAHSAPSRLYARLLGWLGGARGSGQNLRLRRIPGTRSTLIAERNYIVLTRSAGNWSAYWELERSGRTPSIEL